MIKQIKTYEEFHKYLDFLEGAIDRILSKTAEVELTPQDCLAAIRRQLKNESFILLINLVDETPLAFCTALVVENLYEEQDGVVWMLSALPGAETKGLPEILRRWFAERKVKKVYASNLDFGGAKARWLRRMGFKMKYQVWQRSV